MGQVPGRPSDLMLPASPRTHETGTSWAGTGALEHRERPRSGHELAAPLAWPPGTMAALWQVFSGLDESKGSISQRFAVALEQPTFHNYGLSIRTKTNGHWWTPVQNILGDTAPLAESCIHKAVAERGLTPGHVGLADANAEDESATGTAFALRID